MVRNDYPRAVEFLEGAMRKRDEINRMRGRLDALRSASTNITAKVSDMPRPASPNVHRFEDMMLKIVDLEREIQEAEIALAGIKADIALRITEWADAEAAEMMMMRYVDGKHWDVIADELSTSKRTLFRILRPALETIEEKITV